MIYLKTNSINYFYVTLKESSNIAASGGTPFYLFELYNQSEREYKYVYPVLFSSTPRFDLLKLTVSGTGQNLTAGTINLKSGTHYDYNIFEKNSNVELYALPTDNKVESGILTVSGSTTQLFDVYSGSTNNFNIYYNN